MIAEIQKPPSVRERVVHDVQKVKEWVLEHIRVKQKPELDSKLKELELRKITQRKVILSLAKGVGASFGKKLGGIRRLGKSIGRIFGF